MARDKALDDIEFNCSEDWEVEYVSDLYEQKEEVADFLKKKCEGEEIKNFTHLQVYELIKKELGYSIPVSKISKLKIKED